MGELLLGISVETVILLIPLLPLIGAVINGLITITCRIEKSPTPKSLVGFIALLMPLLSFSLALWLFFFAQNPAQGFVTKPYWNWISVGDLSIPIAFKIDRLSLLLSLIITGVGTLIHLFSLGYMSHDEGFSRYFTYLHLFVFSMLILVFGSSLPLLFIGWEGVGVCSYLLIGFWFEDSNKASAGKKAFIVNRIGDLGFLLGMFLIYATLSAKGIQAKEGLLSFDVIQQYKAELFTVATPICLFLFIGAMGKSAQIPLYVWLPDAMAGPTPVSALIHAATMVTAGIYLICRLNFLYVLTPISMQFIATIGVFTAFFAALIALTQSDIKKVLAYSTVSQLGYMFYAVGVGAFSAGVFHLMTHAFFKACLFLASGSVIHAMHEEQNMWKMGGLKKKMPITFWTTTMAVLAICGIFPFAGFFSKDAILWQGFVLGPRPLWVIAFITAGLTAFYMCRLLALTFFGQARDREKYLHAHESPLSMTIPLIVLAILSLVGGWVGIPESIFGHDHFFEWFFPIFPYEEFLNPLHAHGHGLEFILSFITLFWCFCMGLFSILLYSQRLSLLNQWTQKLKMVHSWSMNKFYIDEVYEFLFVKPIHRFSEKFLWKFFDQKVVDSLIVEGSAESVGLMGKTLSLLNQGQVQSYALFFVIGAVAVIVCLAYSL